MTAFEQIIDLLRDKVSAPVLADIYALLDQMDTESKREILRYQRELERKGEE